MIYSIVNLHNVSHRYPSGTLALDSINLLLPKGKKIAILGENGAGKSTLMFLLNGIIQPTSGYLCFDSIKYNYNKRKLRELRSKVGYLFQDSDNQLIAPTVYEEISFGLNNLYKDKDKVRKKVDAIIDAFCLDDLSDKTPHELSAGQKKLVCLASVLAMEPELIVCDEPASCLDPSNSKLTFDYLNKFQEQGKTIIISTHDVNMAYEWADFIIILKKGKILISGTPQEVFSRREILKKAGLNIPFVVEASYSLLPQINFSELPTTMDDFKKLLNIKLCMDS